MDPGAMTLTRILCGASLMARVFEWLMRAALAALPSRLIICKPKAGRVVDEDVYRPQRRLGGLEKAVKRFRVAHIANPGPDLNALIAQFSFRLLQSICAARPDRDVRTLLSQTERDRSADSLAGTRNHGALATKAQ